LAFDTQEDALLWLLLEAHWSPEKNQTIHGNGLEKHIGLWIWELSNRPSTNSAPSTIIAPKEFYNPIGCRTLISTNLKTVSERKRLRALRSEEEAVKSQVDRISMFDPGQAAGRALAPLDPDGLEAWTGQVLENIRFFYVSTVPL
jgi:hypothetical protein